MPFLSLEASLTASFSYNSPNCFMLSSRHQKRRVLAFWSCNLFNCSIGLGLVFVFVSYGSWSWCLAEIVRLHMVDKAFERVQAYMSDALGVGAFLESSDGQVVLMKRGEHLAEAPGLWDIPGGHPEPQVMWLG